MDNTNRGAIWKNEKKEKETHPDFTGSLNIDGTEYWVNAWRRKDDAPAKAPALSFTVRPKDAQQSNGPLKPDPRITTGRQDMDDEIPF